MCGESSPLYQRLYEEGLIDSDFAVGYEMVKGMPNVSVSGDSEDPQRVLDAILTEARRITTEGVEDGLFQRLKRAALGRRIRGLDSFDGLCYRLAISCFDQADYFQFPEMYDQITGEDVRAFIRAHITEETAVLSVIRPKQKEE